MNGTRERGEPYREFDGTHDLRRSRKSLTGSLTLGILFIVGLLLLFPACKPDPCKQLACQNGGDCFDGFCDCPTGFTGQFCQDTVGNCDTVECFNGGICYFGECECPAGWDQPHCGQRTTAKFVGAYEIIETCDLSGVNTFNVYISESPTILGRIFIDNLVVGTFVTAEITGTYSFTIPTQLVSGMTISGDGSIDPSATNIFMNYTMDDGGYSTNVCTATLNKF